MVTGGMVEELGEEFRFKERTDYIKTTGVLIADAFFFSLAALIGSAKFFSITNLGFRFINQPPQVLFISIFCSVFIGGFFVGWVHKLVMRVLGGTGTSLQGISVVAYSILPVSMGSLAGSGLAYVPTIGPILSYIFIFLSGALGYAILYRATKEFFEVNMITAFVGVSLLIAAGTGAFYASFLAASTNINTIFRFIRP